MFIKTKAGGNNPAMIPVLILTGIVFFAVLFFVLSYNSQAGEKENAKKVLEIVEKSENGMEFIKGQSFDTKVTALNAEAVKQLKTDPQNGIIFDGVPEKKVYQVDYSSQEKGSFVAVVDLEQEKVLKFFRVASIKMGTS